MSAELSAKIQTAIWWITSIAISVVCCSVLFVLFASYLVDVKESVKDSNERITIIQEREDRILDEIAVIRKRAVFQPIQPTAAVPAPANAPEAPATLSVDGPGTDKAPAATAPTSLVPAEQK